MLATILTYIVLIFAIIGLTHTIENIWLYIIKPKNQPARVTIIKLKKDIFKLQIFEILEEKNWRGEKGLGQVFAINYDIDETEFMKIKNEFKDSNIIFLEKTELKNWTP